jgi:hypothetical protein
MRILALVLFASLSQSIAKPVYAENALSQPLRDGLDNIGDEIFFPVEFPNCVMDFHSVSDEMLEAGSLLRATDNVDLSTGAFRGTWAFRFPDEHDYEGSYVVEVKCGSGLGQIKATPN